MYVSAAADAFGAKVQPRPGQIYTGTAVKTSFLEVHNKPRSGFLNAPLVLYGSHLPDDVARVALDQATARTPADRALETSFAEGTSEYIAAENSAAKAAT